MSTYIDELAVVVQDAIPADVLPQDAKGLDELFRLYALLVLVKGEDVTAADVHDAWAVWMVGQDRGHRSILPFEALSEDVQRQDQPFVDALRTVARGRKA